MIDKATVQRIKDTANIVEVVSDYVHLTRRGSNYMGLCPFHNERTPSFSVNPRRNICHCFSCGKGGSPINFVMEKEGISYHDALKQLAKKYGIKVEERELTPEERQLATEREGLMVAAEAVRSQLEEDLLNTDEGRAIGLTYFYQRGVTDEAIKAFHLGYAIDKGNYLTPKMINRGFELETLKKLGVTGVSQSGNSYDKYRGRVIFPIMNSSGKTVGFGGRDLKGGPAKYINSPESVLYRKNNELYGIYQAKNEIVRQNRCFLVEGYLDVISMWQSGMKNVVASSGTALTDGQIATIHRFSPNITVVYDGDAAGIKAALRGIDMLLTHKMKVTVLLLPDGHDPDSFARSHTPEEFQEYVADHSSDIIRFKMEVLMKDAGDDPHKRAEVVSSVVNSIACIDEGVDRTIYVGECARIMKIDEGAVAAAVDRARIRILEQRRIDQKRKKDLASIDRDYPPTAGPQNPAEQQADNNTANSQSNNPDVTGLTSHSVDEGIAKQIYGKSTGHRNPMYPLEKRMIELIVKFGYLQYNSLSEAEMDEGVDDPMRQSAAEEDEGYYSIADFVYDELAADKVDFSEPTFKRVFDKILDNIDDFLDAYASESGKLDAEYKQKLDQEREHIIERASTVADIEREEKQIIERLEKERDESLQYFARYYPGNLLASDPDADVRKIATEVVSEKYVLSAIFTKAGTSVADSDEVQAVIRALTEWKSELLNQMLKNTMEDLRKLSEAIDSGNFADIKGANGEEVNAENAMQTIVELQRKINSMMAMRAQAARDIGERIICPTQMK